MKADHDEVKRLLKTARGQIDWIIKMIDDDRYCMDVNTQILAATSVLRKANKVVLKAHMESCVREAVEEEKSEEKIDELIRLIDKMNV